MIKLLEDMTEGRDFGDKPLVLLIDKDQDQDNQYDNHVLESDEISQ